MRRGASKLSKVVLWFFLFAAVGVSLDIIGGKIWGVTDDNTLNCPNWYTYFLVFLSLYIPQCVLFKKWRPLSILASVKGFIREIKEMREKKDWPKRFRKTRCFLLLCVLYGLSGRFSILIWGVNSENSLNCPAWYAFTMLLASFGLSYFIVFKELDAKIFTAIKQSIEKKKEKKRIKQLTDVELWQAEQKSSQPAKNEEHLEDGQDELFLAARDIVFETQMASVSMLQRRLKLGYERAARIIDQLEEAGYVGPFEGSAPRKVFTDKPLTRMEHKTHSDAEIKTAATPVPRQNLSNNDLFLKYGGVDAELLTVDLMEGHDFEHWCANLLLKTGFSSADVTPGSGDQGVDIVAVKEGVRYAVQCKCYSSDLGNKPIQEVYAGKEMYNCQVGVVMTNRHFTNGAKELAGRTRVLLWDREVLASLIEKQNSLAH